MSPEQSQHHLTSEVLRRGKREPPPREIHLRAGPLSCILDSGLLRYIRLGRFEVIRRIYVALRDRNWGTVPAVLSRVQVEARANSFEVSYFAEHREDDIDFAWHGTIRGEADGTIHFAMDGETRSTFLRSRIGFCVLHPLAGCVGMPCTVEKVDGSVERGLFPSWISPEAPFLEILAITHELSPGLKARVSFEGEVFEMEDHRNWTDASFKTFCTPLVLPYPVEVKRGTKIWQSVTVKLEGSLPVALEPREPGVAITIGSVPGARMPRIGLGCASHGKPLTSLELNRLKELRLSHLRVDLKLSSSGALHSLRQASSEAISLGVALEAAIHLSSNAASELEALSRALDEIRPPITSLLVFREGEMVSPEQLVRLVWKTLQGRGALPRIGGGTDAEFVEVNRQSPPLALIDFIGYSMNPQVHAFDDETLIESLEAQRATVESARRLFGGLPLAITPVTLKRRFNPGATGPEREPGPCELPPQVDARQMSLFGAVWTAGSIQQLAESGVESVTFYETTGWRGVMETAAGSPDPICFPSIPGSVFPLYNVLADVGEMREGEIVPSTSSDPLKAGVLAVRLAGKLRVILSNRSPQPQLVEVLGLRGEARVWHLDETNAEEAMVAPETFRRRPGIPARGPSERLEITLQPYSIARIDASWPKEKE